MTGRAPLATGPLASMAEDILEHVGQMPVCNETFFPSSSAHSAVLTHVKLWDEKRKGHVTLEMQEPTKLQPTDVFRFTLRR